MKCCPVAFYFMTEPGGVSQDMAVAPDGEPAADNRQSQVQSQSQEDQASTEGLQKKPKECSGLNVKQHYILVIECLYFENLCVSGNANNGIYLKYTLCFCMLPPGGFGYPKKNTPFHILSPSLQHGLPWAIAPGGGWATCDA